MARDHGHVSELKWHENKSQFNPSAMSMMRIAVAGTGGLARLIAHVIDRETGHHVVFLSRQEQRELSRSYQVSVVDYSDPKSLQFALRGIDTVISTVTGPNQIHLIKAAVSVRVRRFAPAEFEGLPALRPDNDPLDRGRSVARQWLAYYAQHIQSTTFVCGILFERFQPGGLRRSSIGLTSGFSNEGDYIMNCRTMAAKVPCYDSRNTPNVTICITAARDVAKFVTKALDMPQWPSELRMCGERVTVMDLVCAAERMKGRAFNPTSYHSPASLGSELQIATVNQDRDRQLQLHALIATAEGRYDYTQFNANQLFPDVKTISFSDWFVAMWNSET